VSGSYAAHTALTTFDSPARAINAAIAMRAGAQALGVELRAGLHAGEIELRGNDIGGIAVHVAQRVLTCALPGEIVASSTVRDLVTGSGIDFDPRGARQLKGVPGDWLVLVVTS
jgi:class 3 adenylate cyclase